MKLLSISRKINTLLLFSIVLFSKSSICQSIKIDKLYVENDTIEYLILKKDNVIKPTILFIQGSLCYPILLNNKEKTEVNLPFDYNNYLDKVNFLIINRKGCPHIYEKESINEVVNNPSKIFSINDNLKYRVFQANSLIRYLKEKKLIDRLFVVGHSEGYRVASKLSEENTEIDKLVCMSSNPFSRSVEVIIKKTVENYLKEDDKDRNDKIDDEIFYNYMINENPDSDYNYYSYNKHLPLNSFKKFDKPILIAFGSNDLSSSLNLLLPFILVDKQNIEIKNYSNLGHNFEKIEIINGIAHETFQWDEVFKECFKWLMGE